MDCCLVLVQGIFFRFQFLMLVTLACAALTVVFFILNQVSALPHAATPCCPLVTDLCCGSPGE